MGLVIFESIFLTVAGTSLYKVYRLRLSLFINYKCFPTCNPHTSGQLYGSLTLLRSRCYGTESTIANPLEKLSRDELKVVDDPSTLLRMDNDLNIRPLLVDCRVNQTKVHLI